MYLLIISPCHICKHIQQHPLELWMFIFHHSSIDSRRFVPTQAPCPFETFSQFCLKLWIYLFLFVFSLVISLLGKKTHDLNFLSVKLPIRLKFTTKRASVQISSYFILTVSTNSGKYSDIFSSAILIETNN